MAAKIANTVGGILFPWSATDRKTSIAKANGGSLMLGVRDPT